MITLVQNSCPALHSAGEVPKAKGRRMHPMDCNAIFQPAIDALPETITGYNPEAWKGEEWRDMGGSERRKMGGKPGKGMKEEGSDAKIYHTDDLRPWDQVVYLP
jgi:hypothetical protein